MAGKPSDKAKSKQGTVAIKNIIKRIIDFQDQIIVVKLPSNIIGNDELLTNFAENVKLLRSCRAKIFIIHDYVGLVDDTLKNLGIEHILNSSKLVGQQSAAFAEMVISGYLNKLIVSKLCAAGCDTVGISGKDSNLLQVQQAKFAHKRVASDVINVGFISEPNVANADLLLNFEENDVIPVISPISGDAQGRTHLLEANMTASVIAEALDAEHLVLLHENPILADQNIKFDDIHELQELFETIANKHEHQSAGLMRSAVYAIQHSARWVYLSYAKGTDVLIRTLFY